MYENWCTTAGPLLIMTDVSPAAASLFALLSRLIVSMLLIEYYTFITSIEITSGLKACDAGGLEMNIGFKVAAFVSNA